MIGALTKVTGENDIQPEDAGFLPLETVKNKEECINQGMKKKCGTERCSYAILGMPDSERYIISIKSNPEEVRKYLLSLELKERQSELDRKDFEQKYGVSSELFKTRYIKKKTLFIPITVKIPGIEQLPVVPLEIELERKCWAGNKNVEKNPNVFIVNSDKKIGDDKVILRDILYIPHSKNKAIDDLYAEIEKKKEELKVKEKDYQNTKYMLNAVKDLKDPSDINLFLLKTQEKLDFYNKFDELKINITKNIQNYKKNEAVLKKNKDIYGALEQNIVKTDQTIDDEEQNILDRKLYFMTRKEKLQDFVLLLLKIIAVIIMVFSILTMIYYSKGEIIKKVTQDFMAKVTEPAENTKSFFNKITK